MTVQLEPFQIGCVRIDIPVVLAPLAGYSDPAYRLLCRQLGAPYCATEMMLDKCLLAGPKLRRQLLRVTEDDHPLAGQIIGGDPGRMAAAAEWLCKSGPDVIDLNFACPVRKAIRRQRGGHLMRRPRLAVEITRAVLGAADRPVTLKLRRGFDEDDETHEAFWRIAESAFDAGAAAICLHPRSVEAKYTGRADWEFLARVKSHFHDKTVIGSGDVLTPRAALDMLGQTRVDAVAVARGAIGNPWFFRQVRDLAAARPPYQPDLAEQRDLLGRHFTHACELYGQRRGPKIMRKFGIKYARLHPAPRKVRAAFINVRRPEDWPRVLDESYVG